MSLSVLIVTKNRAIDLLQCIGSLLSNSKMPEEIIVVDNNSTDHTKQLIFNLNKNSKVAIRYVFYPGQGYPAIYNAGLEAARGDWIACIDDDCIADNNWILEIKKILKKHPKKAAVMGWCNTYYKNNIYSLATVFLDNRWKESGLKGASVEDFEILDNKNVVYRRSFLQKNKLQYDESRIRFQNGAAEDCDLGIQIQESGGTAVCNKNMLIAHKDPQDWLWLMKKNYSSCYAYQSLSLKWDMTQRSQLKKKLPDTRFAIIEFAKQYSLSTFQTIQLFLVVKQVVLLDKMLSLLSRISLQPSNRGMVI